MYKYLKGECKEYGAKLFSVMPSGTRGNGHKVKHRGIQKLPRHGPWQVVLGVPA